MLINLICTTKGCENFEISVPYPNPADLCLCGGCCQEITRKEPVEK